MNALEDKSVFSIMKSFITFCHECTLHYINDVNYFFPS